jgi:hypothetical protein
MPVITVATNQMRKMFPTLYLPQQAQGYGIIAKAGAAL